MKLVFKGIIILFLSLILIPYAIKAQDWEYGVSVGTSGYMGEYNLDNIFKFNSVSGSIGVKYNFNPTWGVRGNLSGIGIKWDDGQSVNNKAIGEVSVVSEFNFFKFEPNTKEATYTPYVFAGVGFAGFKYKKVKDPFQSRLTTQYLKEKDSFLNPIEIIGQYKPVVIFGTGFKYNLKSSFTIDTHLSYRLAGTDMLDDKGSGWNGGFWDKINQIDSYMTFQIGLSYTFFKQGCPTW